MLQGRQARRRLGRRPKRGEKQRGREGGLEQLAPSRIDENQSAAVIARSVATRQSRSHMRLLDCFARARDDGSWRFDEAGFMEFNIGHFRSLRTRWRGVICAFGSREEFCDRNTFDRPPVLTGLRRSAERKPPFGAKHTDRHDRRSRAPCRRPDGRGRKGCPDDANRAIFLRAARHSPARGPPARGLARTRQSGQIYLRTTRPSGECRPNRLHRVSARSRN